MNSTKNTKLFSMLSCLLLSLMMVVLCNAISVNLIDYFNLFSESHETIKILERIHQNVWITITSRDVPFLLEFSAMIYCVWPLFNEIKNKNAPEDFSDQNKLRVLRFPIAFSLLCYLGWICGNTLMLGCAWSIGIPVSVKTFVETTIFILVLGGITSVLTYYSLEFIQREWMIPQVFPNGGVKINISKRTLTIKHKLFIFLFSAALLPALIYYRFLMTLNNEGHNSFGKDYSYLILSCCLGIVLVATLITIFKSYSIHKPIMQMIEAAKKIEQGQFNFIIPANGDDEIGELAQRMNFMLQGLRERETMKQVFGKVVDPNIRDYLMKNSLKLGGELKYVTILFCDLEGFSSLSERKNPLYVVNLLNQYFELMTDVITKEKGYVNKYIGDALLAVFGAPLEVVDHADAATSAAFKMQEALLFLNHKLSEEGIPPLKNRIGIHSGEVLAGIIGSQLRMEYTVIGDTVNVASRLEKMAKELDQSILISEETWKNLKVQDRDVRFVNEIQIKGRSKLVRVFTKVS